METALKMKVNHKLKWEFQKIMRKIILSDVRIELYAVVWYHYHYLYHWYDE